MTQDPDVMRSRADRQAAQAWAFDRIGEHYDEAFPHKDGQLAAGEWLLERLAPGSRVLDVGSGTGIPTARQLTDAGHQVVGVDISEEMLRLARRDVPAKVVIDEYVAVAGAFFGADEPGFVNGALDNIARRKRAVEFGLPTPDGESYIVARHLLPITRFNLPIYAFNHPAIWMAGVALQVRAPIFNLIFENIGRAEA